MDSPDGEALELEALRQGLIRYIGVQLGRDDVDVTTPRRAGAGSSRENWLFDAELSSTKEPSLPLVLRRDPSSSLLETTRRHEVRILQALQGMPVPAPKVRWLEESGDALGRPFLIMDRSPGVADRRLLRSSALTASQRLRVAHAVCDALADIHVLPVATSLQGDPDVPRPTAHEQVDYWAQQIGAASREPQPLLRMAQWWLTENLPAEPRRPSLVHGDYRVENILVDNAAIETVIDWELAHLGSPVEDVAWYLLRRYRSDHFLGSDWSPAEFLSRYEARTGFVIDPDELRFWSVLALYKSAAIALTAATAFVEESTGNPVASASYFTRELAREIFAEDWK